MPLGYWPSTPSARASTSARAAAAPDVAASLRYDRSASRSRIRSIDTIVTPLPRMPSPRMPTVPGLGSAVVTESRCLVKPAVPALATLCAAISEARCAAKSALAPMWRAEKATARA